MDRIKCHSGIQGLDTLLKGGFLLSPESTSSYVLLIRGKPGTGKSTLALKIASEAYSWALSCCTNEVKYYTCEQKSDEITEKCKTFGIDYETSVKCKNRFEILSSMDEKGDIGDISHESPFKRSTNAFSWANHVAMEIGKSNKCRMIVVDGLNLLGKRERTTYDLENLVNLLRKRSLFSIIVYEPQKDEESIIDSIVDMIIELKGVEYDGPIDYYFNMLSITKSRSQQCVLGWHQYKMKDINNKDEKGIVVFPSVHFYTSKYNSLSIELEKSMMSFNEQAVENSNNYKKINGLGEDGIVQNVINNKIEDNSYLSRILSNKREEHYLKKGSCTVILGSRRTCKTLISLDFMCEGAANQEKALLVSLLDNKDTIIDNKLCFKNRCKNNCGDKKICYDNLHLLHYRPGCITSNEFFAYLKRRIKKGYESDASLKRVAFWDLTQIDYRFPFLSKDQMFLPALMDFFKHNTSDKDNSSASVGDRITSVYIGSFHCKLANAASTMADNVLLCLRDSLLVRNNSEVYQEIDGIYVYVDRIEGKPGLKHLIFIELLDEGVFGDILFIDTDGKIDYTTDEEFIQVNLVSDNMNMHNSKLQDGSIAADKCIRVIKDRIKGIENKFINLVEEIEKAH